MAGDIRNQSSLFLKKEIKAPVKLPLVLTLYGVVNHVANEYRNRIHCRSCSASKAVLRSTECFSDHLSKIEYMRSSGPQLDLAKAAIQTSPN